MMLAIAIVLPQVSEAIVPPEFIVTVGSNLLQILGMIALVFISIYSALAIFIHRGYSFVKTYALPIVFSINFLAAGILYVYIKDTDSKMDYIVAESNQLRTDLLIAEETLSALKEETGKGPLPSIDCSLNDTCQAGKKFFSNTYVVVAKDVTLELDINRIEVEPYSSVYNNYAYLNGVVKGNSITDYLQVVSTSTDSFSRDFLQQFKVVDASDLSARANHTIALNLNDMSEFKFTTAVVDADFITRNSPAYSRTHSVSTTTIYIDSEPLEAKVYIEKTYSDDADNAIFFPGSDKLSIKTAQFIFWDNINNFYLFDSSNLATPVPQYQSHTWLLMKRFDGLSRKSYSGSYREVTSGVKLGWELDMPDFHNAKVELVASEIFKSRDGRLRVEIIGNVTDDEGTRNIFGVGHLIQ